MISLDVLRKLPFFSFMNPDHLSEVATITDAVKYDKGQILFKIDEVADKLFLLLEGAVDLHYVVVDEHEPDHRKEFVVGTINPGEVLGISSVIEPFVYTATALAVNESRLLKIDAVALKGLCADNPELDFGLQRIVAKATMERLHATRILLAAARAPE